MSNSIINNNSEKSVLLKWFLIIMLVWALPSGIFWTGIYLFITEDCNRKDNQALDTLETKLENISYSSSTSRYFQTKFSTLYNTIQRLPTNPVNNLQKVLDSFTKRYPEEMLEVYLFNGASEILKTKGARKEHELFMNLVTADYAKGQITTEQLKTLGKFMPEPSVILRRVREQKDKAILLGNPSRYSLCYYNYQEGVQPQNVAGILIFVHFGKMKVSSILSETIKDEEDISFGYISNSESSLPKHLKGSLLTEGFINNYYRFHPTNRFRYDSRLICLNKLNDNCILIGAMGITQPSFGLILVFALMFLVASGLFFKATYQAYVVRQNTSLNIRKRLTWLFVLCYVFPLITATILASQYLMELKSSLLTTEKFNNYKRLSEIDTGFSRFITSKLMEYRKGNSQFRKIVEDEKELVNRMKQLCIDNKIDSIHLVASDSRLLISSDLISSIARGHSDKSLAKRQEIQASWIGRNAVLTPNYLLYLFDPIHANPFPKAEERSEAHKVFAKVFSSTGISAMDFYNQSQNIAVASNKTGSDLIVESVMENHSMSLFQTAKTNISKFTVLQGMNEVMFCYLDILPGPKGESWYAYAIINGLVSIENEYLEQVFYDIKLRNNMINRVFLEEDVRAISTHAFATCFPNLLEFQNFETIIRQSDKDSKTFTHKMTLKGEPVYVSVLKGSFLQHYLLLDVFSESKIESLYKKEVKTVITLFIVIMIMGLALARLMTKFLVLPITDIINGVNSIANKRYDCVIKVRSDNEFGVMSRAFNNTAALLKKLKISDKMNYYLFPEKEFRCGSYTLFSSICNYEAVNSDFYDVLPLKSGAFAIITARVTGNDATAAHIIALLKAAFITLMPVYPKGPDIVMDNLNILFAPYVKNKHLVSCLITVLDPMNDSVTCCNAGQPYPITVDIQNKIESNYISLPSPSLGLNQSNKYTKTEVSLHRKVFVLYSLGATNSINEMGEELGKEEFLKIVCNSIKPENRNPSEAITDSISKYTQRVTWRQDVGVIAIQNRI